MVVVIDDIKTNLGISTSDNTQDAMFNKHLGKAQTKFSDFSDNVIEYYATYLSAVTIASASRVQRDDDVVYFKYDPSYWLNLFETEYDEELAEKEDISGYAVVELDNVRVD